MAIAPKPAVVTSSSGDVSHFINFRFSNIVSIFNKSAAVKLFCSKVDVTGLVETRDCPDYVDNLFANLTSFNVFRKPRDQHGGGVAAVVRKSLKGFRRADLELPDIEMLMIDLTSANLIICVFYSPPVSVRVNTVRFVEHIRTLPHDIIRRLVVMGDFNMPDVDWTSRTARTVYGHTMLDACREFSLKQIVNFPTRLNNTLDLALLPATMPYDRLEAISAPAEKCDHLAFEF